MKKVLIWVGTVFLFHTGISGAQNLLTTLPDWNDEQTAYQTHTNPSLTIFVANYPNYPRTYIDAGLSYSEERLGYFAGGGSFTNQLMHEDTEGDDLWTAYHMWKRLVASGIPADTWIARVETYKDFYINNYPQVIAGSGKETDNNYDHIYGWGLCDWYKTEGSSDPDGPAAITALNSLIASMEAWHNVYAGGTDPGDSIFGNSNGTRRWPRQLRLATCVAEVSPTQFNIDWRDHLIDIIMQSPEFNDTHNMYFYTAGETSNKGFSDPNHRVVNTFHMGILMEALWQVWRVLDAEADPRTNDVKQRLIDMATYYRDKAPEADGRVPLLTGIDITTGNVINTSSTGYGSENVYSISPINGLVFVYKFTGTQSYLDSAWEKWLVLQEEDSGGLVDTIYHYTDAQLSSANGYRLLRHNKGELQYNYALFENGGVPGVIGAGQTDFLAPAAPTLISVE